MHLCHLKHSQDHWQEIKTEDKNLYWKRDRAPEGFFPPLFVALCYVSLFYGCSNFKCIFLSCEIHSFNFPGSELEGLIDGQMCVHVCVHTSDHKTYSNLAFTFRSCVLFDYFVPDAWDQTFPATLNSLMTSLNTHTNSLTHTHTHACTHAHKRTVQTTFSISVFVFFPKENNLRNYYGLIGLFQIKEWLQNKRSLKQINIKF